MIVIIIILVILFLLIYFGFYFSTLAMKPKVKNYDEIYNIEINSGRINKDIFESLEKEEFSIDSPFGYKLHAMFFPVNNSKKTIILCHGITYSLYGCVKYMDIFIKRGFNVFLYDHRFHGKSKGDFCTFGYYEKQDLKTCVNWVITRCGNDSIVGTMGESMGAATVLQHTLIDDRISFCIADCPYSDLMDLLKIRLKEDYNLPPFPLIYISNLVNKLRFGIYYSDISPIRDIQKVKTPIFFIHGKNDTYIPSYMSEDMYNVKQGFKKLYIAPNSDHVQSYVNNKYEYEKLINEFLKDINIL